MLTVDRNIVPRHKSYWPSTQVHSSQVHRFCYQATRPEFHNGSGRVIIIRWACQFIVFVDQGLSGKVDEPKSSVIKYLDHMHDSFLFYYGSPDYVMEVCHTVSCD